MLNSINNFNTLGNLNLLVVGLTIAAIGLLGVIVYFNNPKSATNRTFLLFTLTANVYACFNFISYQVTSATAAIWLIRLVIFSAIWYAFSLFQLLYVFPAENFKFSQWYKKGLIPLTALTSIFNLTPYVFSKIEESFSVGQVALATPQPGVILFGVMSMCLVFGGIFVLAKKFLIAEGNEKKQLKFVVIGTAVTYSLIIIFNLVLPAFFGNVKFVPLVPVFTIPFIILTAYSIVKHHLLNVKVIATEVLTFVLSAISLFEVILSNSAAILIFRLSIFALVLAFGTLLIKSVRKEVQQREQLEILSKQLEEANKQLKILDQARAEFITIASHQLRTPPATIKWYLSAVLAGDYGPLPAEIKEVVEKTNRTNSSLISLIDDMLNVSRIERGKMEFLFKETNPQKLAELTFEQLLPIAKEKHLELVFQPPAQPLPSLMADEEKLRQVMNNIIDNALKYTKQGRIEMKIFQDNNDVVFEVKDTGKGFETEEQEAIFGKYMRGKDAQNHSTGLGLGMYVAKAIIEQHHGKIWAQSPGANKGSTFAFSIPIKNSLKATTLLDFTKTQNL